jgi:hypothetical protein
VLAGGLTTPWRGTGGPAGVHECTGVPGRVPDREPDRIWRSGRTSGTIPTLSRRAPAGTGRGRGRARRRGLSERSDRWARARGARDAG